MVKSQRGKSRVDVRLADDIIDMLEKIAAEKDQTVSYVVRLAISDYLVREKKTGAPEEHKDIRYETSEERKKKAKK